MFAFSFSFTLRIYSPYVPFPACLPPRRTLGYLLAPALAFGSFKRAHSIDAYAAFFTHGYCWFALPPRVSRACCARRFACSPCLTRLVYRLPVATGTPRSGSAAYASYAPCTRSRFCNGSNCRSSRLLFAIAACCRVPFKHIVTATPLPPHDGCAAVRLVRVRQRAVGSSACVPVLAAQGTGRSHCSVGLPPPPRRIGHDVSPCGYTAVGLHGCWLLVCCALRRLHTRPMILRLPFLRFARCHCWFASLRTRACAHSFWVALVVATVYGADFGSPEHFLVRLLTLTPSLVRPRVAFWFAPLHTLGSACWPLTHARTHRRVLNARLRFDSLLPLRLF